ncbi:MAG: HEAT repeat domain-containing protein, partial [Brasilonema sp.]
AIRVVKLALGVDFGLGARLAGEVNPQWQQDTVRLVTALDVLPLYKVYLLGKTGSEVAIPVLIQALQDEDWEVRSRAASALDEIGSETAIPALINQLKNPDFVKTSFHEAIRAIEAIQNKCQHYYPPQPIASSPEENTNSPSQLQIVHNFYGTVQGVAGNVEGNMQVNSDENR